MRILGIDPGKKGALALFLTLTRPESGRWVLADMPERMTDLRDFLRKYSPDLCYLEHTARFPKLARNLGRVEGVVQCLDIPLTLVSPVAWKNHHGLMKQDKHASRARAIHLFPEMAQHLRLAKHDGRAEAMLIATYGAHRHGELL